MVYGYLGIQQQPKEASNMHASHKHFAERKKPYTGIHTI